MKNIIIASFFLFVTGAIYAQVTPINRQLAVKIISKQKAVMVRSQVVDLKGQLKKFSDSVSVIKYEIDNTVATMQNDMANKSEMGETESLRLQMVMERLSKMMSTLSNLLKKASETASQITQNIK